MLTEKQKVLFFVLISNQIPNLIKKNTVRQGKKYVKFQGVELLQAAANHAIHPHWDVILETTTWLPRRSAATSPLGYL